MKTIWYYLWKAFLKTSLFFYCKKIAVSGVENIPKKGGVLFLINHPNGLIDPLLVTTHLPRINHYLVRGDVFKKPFVKKLLGSLNLMPIYRIRDGASQLGKNQEIFENCFQIFKNGGTLMIFPEGSHERKRAIRPLSKGFTRIVFGAIEKYKDLKITLIPVGLTYQNPSEYPSKVAIKFGKPILGNDFYNPKELPFSTVKLKNEVSYQLKQLSVHIPDDKEYQNTLKKLNDANVDFTKVDSINKMMGEEDIPSAKSKPENNFTFLLYLIKVNSLFPFIIWKIVSKKINEIEFVDTFRFGINAISFPLFYGIQSWILYLLFGWKIAVIYFAVSVVLVLLYTKLSPTNTEISSAKEAEKGF